jgi:hypothetical protein
MSEPAMEAIQPASERTKTVEVITRKVVTEKDVTQELERPDSVFVRPLPFRRWPQAIGHIARLLEFIPKDGVDFNDNTQLAVFVGTVSAYVSDDLFAVMELATDRKPEFFDTLDADDGLKVMIAVVEVNKDFFLQNVKPLIEQYLPAITENLTETPGLTQ